MWQNIQMLRFNTGGAMQVTLPELLQLSSSYWKSCTIHAGVKLDIFTHLVETPRPGEQ